MSDKPDSGSPASEPVAWMDDFGNVFPLGAIKGAGSWRDEHQRNWKPLFAHPPAAPDFADAYQGARDDLLIWKRRALEAEELARKFSESINGPVFMGEPVRTTRPAAHPPAALPEPLVDEREAFNRWTIATWGRMSDVPKNHAVDAAWEAWQARAALAARDDADAERYRLLRRGQHWSVINGIGDVLRADELDAVIDSARGKDADQT